ncbi:MAG TPA: urate hydroxylase PuuD, partial [Hyphomicrobiaceae bacterium]|nr:urate hydroxylase PuuD [Hyphomicrobiaceae bacterium]
MWEILWIWGEAFLRWLHLIAAIGWIGSSFYFIHLDYSLQQRQGLPEHAYGEAWQVHGGGFYNMVKYLVAPTRMPDELTWFKWEAYTTWISGLALIVAIYYAGASLYLIDPAVLAIAPATGIAISITSLGLGWAVYDGLCRSPIRRNDTLLAAVGFAFIVALAYAFTKVFSARGAFMQIGALIGTIMAANVLMVIIPGQRKVVADLIAKRAPDPLHGQRGKQRSTHNNYLTLPVVFVMISNHYPLAYATRFSWLILALVLVIGGLLRHFYNVRHQRRPSPWWTWGLAALCGLAIIGLSALGPATIDRPRKRADAPPAAPAFREVEAIVASRCSMCHAKEPVWAGITVAPKGVLLDTAAHIKANARDIAIAAVWSNA